MATPLEIKMPDVKTDILPLIQKRWSPLAFSDRPISELQMEELLEAAGWAASAYNEQPWRYIYAHRGSEGFDLLWSCLSEGNQPWAQSASVLLVALSKNIFKTTGKLNIWASHDLGMANAQLLLQAVHRNIYGHLMAGFDKEKLKTLLDLEDDITPVCMGALGYLGNVELLEGNYKKREQSVRSRNPLLSYAKRL